MLKAVTYAEPVKFHVPQDQLYLQVSLNQMRFSFDSNSILFSVQFDTKSSLKFFGVLKGSLFTNPVTIVAMQSVVSENFSYT